MVFGVTPLLLKKPGGLSAIDLDLTLLTEVDPSGDLSITSEAITYTTLSRNVSAYAYREFDNFEFSSNFEIDFQFNISALNTGAYVGFAGLETGIGSAGTAFDAIRVSAFNNAGALQLRIIEILDNTTLIDLMTFSLSTDYFCRFVRDVTVGANGTAYLYVATSDANRDSGIWIDTLSLALGDNVSYPYFYAVQSLNTGNSTLNATGTVSNFSIQAD